MLANAFQPATEVEDPNRFAGRRDEVRRLVESLHVIGSVPLVFGQRGLGKSSLALQMARIAQGDEELLHQHGLEHLALAQDEHFITFHVTCTDATTDFQALLQSLINAVEGVEHDVLDSDNGKRMHLVDRSSRKKLAMKIFEIESTKGFKAASERVSFEVLNLEERLIRLCELIVKFYGQPVLFVVDELDRLRDTKGLAGFLKAYSSEYLKIAMVGIALSQAELLEDHASLSRSLHSVMVPTMTPSELKEIVSRAEEYLAERDQFIEFDSAASGALSDLASGYPWFIHVIGQAALMRTVDQGRTVVSRADVRDAVDGLLKNSFAQQFSDQYQRAVKDSVNREVVLRLFAQWQDADMPTAVVYPMAKSLGVVNPASYKGHLTQAAFGSVLVVPAFQSRGLVRFRDEMFKVYVRMRPSMYEDVDERVETIFRRTV